MGSQARTELDDLKSKNPKRRLSSDKSDDRRKKSRCTSPDIQEKIMMKLKVYIVATMKTRYQRKNLVQNSGGYQSGQGK